jgi:hypothetical protein
MRLLSIIVFTVVLISNTFGQTTPTTQVKTIADLVALRIPTINNRLSALVTGRVTENDGGGGLFFYDASDATSTNLGTIFKPAASAGRWTRQYSGALNVKWFGAVGDDSSDNLDEFQNALNTVSSGGSLYIPNGTFRVSSNLLHIAPITIYGDGNGSKLKLVSSIDENVLTINGANNVTLRDFCIIANGYWGAGYNLATGCGAYLTNCNSSLVSGLIVTNHSGLGVGLWDCSDSKIVNCNIGPANPLTVGVAAGSNVQQTDIAIIGNATNNIVQSNVSKGEGAFGIWVLTPSTTAPFETIKSTSILGNQVSDKGKYGIVVYKNATNSFILDTIVSDNIIKDVDGRYPNVATFFYGMGIYIQGAEDTIVSNNFLRDIGEFTDDQNLLPGAIVFSNCSLASCVGNRLDNIYQRAISWNDWDNQGVAAGAAVVNGNQIQNSNIGIAVYKHPNISISANYIQGCTNQAITITGTSTNSTIFGNSILNCPIGVENDTALSFIWGNNIVGSATNYIGFTTFAEIPYTGTIAQFSNTTNNPVHKVYTDTFTTTDATQHFVGIVAMSPNSSALSRIQVIGKERSSANTIAVNISGAFRCNGAGTVSQVGATSTGLSVTDNGAWAVDYSFFGDSFFAYVTGSATTIDWSASYDYTIWTSP